MRIGPRETDQRVVLVAEIGNNHEGNRSVAEEMIRAAAQAGADAVKFQTFDPEHYVSRSDPERLSRLRRFRLSAEDFRHLATVAEANGTVFFSTPFDLASVDLLEPFVPVFKVASGDITFYPLIERIAETGKPIILSSGLATLDELRRAKALIEAHWHERGLNPGLAILHCVSSYPAPREEANIGAISTLAELGVTVGYSDHTIGIDAAVLAVARGARIIEKHFTLDRNYSEFRDHQLSADPAEMRSLVQRVRQAEVLLGKGTKMLQPSEIKNLMAVRRSIVGVRDLSKGWVLEPGDITWVRPAGGLPPGSEAAILGRRLRQDTPAGKPLTPDLFE